MSMTVMVPVKNLRQAKSRLAGLLSADERRELALVLLRGVLEQVALLPQAVRKVVVTSYRPAMEMAENMGIGLLRETRQVSESDSVDRASLSLEREGVRGVLRVPLDLPLLVAADLQRILDKADSGVQAVLVPSMDGTGTNGLLRMPPSLFPSRFGPGSFKLHQAHLRKLGADYEVLRAASMALDIDAAEDVAELMRLDEDCPASSYLRGIGAFERLDALDLPGR